jgi:hypothetical protein
VVVRINRSTLAEIGPSGFSEDWARWALAAGGFPSHGVPATSDPEIGFVAGFEAGRRDRIHLPLDILAAFSALFTISRVDFLHKYVLVRIDTISRYGYNTMERVRKNDCR